MNPIRLALALLALTATPAVAAATSSPTAELSGGVQLRDQLNPEPLLRLQVAPVIDEHHIAQFTVETQPTADFGIDELRVRVYGRELGVGRLQIGGFGYDTKPLVDAQTAHIDLAGYSLSGSQPVGGSLRLFGGIEGTLSIAQWSSSPVDPRTDLAFALYWCGSASRLAATLGVEVADVFALIFDASAQGDPVHFADGEHCLGDPPTFTSMQRAGVTLRYQLDHAFVATRVGYDHEAIHIDNASRNRSSHAGAHEHDIVDVDAQGYWLATAVAGLTW